MAQYYIRHREEPRGITLATGTKRAPVWGKCAPLEFVLIRYLDIMHMEYYNMIYIIVYKIFLK